MIVNPLTGPLELEKTIAVAPDRPLPETVKGDSVSPGLATLGEMEMMLGEPGAGLTVKTAEAVPLGVVTIMLCWPDGAVAAMVTVAVNELSVGAGVWLTTPVKPGTSKLTAAPARWLPVTMTLSG